MKTIALRSLVVVLVCGCFLFVPCPLYASDNSLMYPSPTCTPDPASLPLVAVVNTTSGVGVTFRGFATGTIILRCAVTVDLSNGFTAFEVIAQDNTPKGGAVTATLYENGFVGTPTPLLSVSTASAPGIVQFAQTPDGDIMLNPADFMYWIEIRMTRTAAANVTVYASGLVTNI